jgi:hypothetical protein
MILVDAHVHIYDCFDLETFLDSACSNFRKEAESSGHENDFTGVLLLAETAKSYGFDSLSQVVDGRRLEGREIGKWRLWRTGEDGSLCAGCDDERRLFVVAGRQVVTAEGVEVLSLANIHSVPEGLPVNRMIEEVVDRGGTPVIPWGFGKWVGRRGQVLHRLLDTEKDAAFFLGDSGNRPFFVPYPAQLKRAQEKGIRNLPGSDPMPLPSGQKKPGSFGFSISERLDRSKPAAHLKEMIRNGNLALRTYGELTGLLDFVRSQTLVRLKRIHR